jgi:predicted molibdopterin-dependent oxidoreductase YjgC
MSAGQFKYKPRSWSTEQSRSACTLCGCGCAVTLEKRRNRVVRVRPAEYDFICAKGRIGWYNERHPARIRTPLVRIGGTLVQSTWEDALSFIATNLNVIKKNRGPKSIGCLGSVRTTNEDNYVFQKFARTVIGTNNVDMVARLKMTPGLNTVFLAGELAQLREHDAILVLDKNVGEINPLTGTEIVRAVKRESKRLVVVSDEPNKFTKIATAVIRSGNAVTCLVRALERPEGERRGEISQAALLLKAAESVAIIVPSKLSPNEEKGIRELAGRLKNVTFYPLVEGGNLQGGLDMGIMPDYYPGYQKVSPRARAMFGKAWNAILPETAGMNALEMIRAIEPGVIAALYIMGDDPVRSDPDTRALLEKLDFLVVQDVLLTETAGIANVVLPASSFFEKTGTFTNVERRLRLLTKAEEFAGESMPDWKIFQTLANRMGAGMNYLSAVEIMMEIKSTVPMYRDLAVDACWPPEQLFPAGTNAVFPFSSLQSQIEKCSPSNGCVASQALQPPARKNRKQ